jgi:ABC-type xylose transport system permease subunit
MTAFEAGQTVRKSNAVGIITVVSALAFIGAIMSLWNANHGVIAFFTALGGGVFVAAGVTLLFEKSEGKAPFTPALVTIIGAGLAVWVSIATGSSDYKERMKKEARAQEVVAKAAVEKARLDALTPEQRDAELKQKAFESERTLRGYILTKSVKESAFDPDALKIKSPEYYKDGVCVSANGKNRFGAYVGWTQYCYIYKNGVWSYSGPN